MSKVKEISVDVAFTKNLGNYQSVKISAGAVVVADKDESAEEVYNKAWEMVGKEVADQLALFGEEKKSGVKKGL